MNLQKIATHLAILSALFGFMSCSSQKKAEAKVASEVKNETVLTNAQLSPLAKNLISSSSNLTDQQKEKLILLQEKTGRELKIVNDQIFQTKTVLIRTLTEDTVDLRDVRILKKSLKKLSQKQMELSLNAIDKAHQIISPLVNRMERESLFDTFMLREHGYL